MDWFLNDNGLRHKELIKFIEWNTHYHHLIDSTTKLFSQNQKSYKKSYKNIL